MKEPMNKHEWQDLRNMVNTLKIEDYPKVDAPTFAEFKKSVITATSFRIWRVWLISISPAVLLWFTEKILGIIQWGALLYLLSVASIIAGYQWEDNVRKKAKERASILGRKAGIFSSVNEKVEKISEEMSIDVLKAEQLGIFGLGKKEWNVKLTSIMAEFSCASSGDKFSIEKQQATSLINFSSAFSDHNVIIKHNSMKLKLLLEDNSLLWLKTWVEK